MPRYQFAELAHVDLALGPGADRAHVPAHHFHSCGNTSALDRRSEMPLADVPKADEHEHGPIGSARRLAATHRHERECYRRVARLRGLRGVPLGVAGPSHCSVSLCIVGIAPDTSTRATPLIRRATLSVHRVGASLALAPKVCMNRSEVIGDARRKSMTATACIARPGHRTLAAARPLHPFERW